MPDGKELKQKQDELEVSILEVALAADLTPQTVYRVYRNDASRKSANMVRKALTRMHERRSLKSKSVG